MSRSRLLGISRVAIRQGATIRMDGVKRSRTSTCGTRWLELPRVSRAAPVVGNPTGRVPGRRISADGQIVAFESNASNLVQGDRNGQPDVFVHNRLTGTTALVSHRPDGRPGNGASHRPAIPGTARPWRSSRWPPTCYAPSAVRLIGVTSTCCGTFCIDSPSHSMMRASGDYAGAWMEPSHGPALDHSGRVLVFSSRHPIDQQDVNNDDDLYVWRRPAAPLE